MRLDPLFNPGLRRQALQCLAWPVWSSSAARPESTSHRGPGSREPESAQPGTS